MTTKWIGVSILVGVAAVTAACESPMTPVGPGSLNSPVSLSAGSTTAAKPPKPGVTFQTTFTGDIEAAAQALGGSRSGSASQGNLKLSAAGGYTLTVVANDDQIPCVDNGLGLVGAPLTGTLSLSIDQGSAQVLLNLKNLTNPNLSRWQLNGNTIVGHTLTITEDSSGVVSATIGRYRLTFDGPRGLDNFGCRVDIVLTLAPA
jgi:hypothetical protein